MGKKQHTRRRSILKALAWAFWGSNLVAIVWVWAVGNLSVLGAGDLGGALIAVARLFGLIATFCVLVQIVTIGRVGWLEPLFGLDKLAIFHRRNGLVAFIFLVLHPLFMTWGYSLVTGSDPVRQYLNLLAMPFIPFALLAEILFIVTVGASIYIVRKHLKFETWYFVHLANYAAVAFVIWHQITYGADILGSEIFYYYWIGLYVFAVLNIVIWRWLLPIMRSYYFGFRVEKVEAATPSATSIYITGKNMGAFTAKAGQFVMVRFLTKKLALEEHPFSLSMIPNGRHFRLTIRRLGDFTNQIPDILVGTRVIVGGPYGAFTHQLQATGKVLYIAGGIGITPIRSLLEERAQWQDKEDAILLYGNRSLNETALWAEIQKLANTIGLAVHNVLSDQPEYKGEKGYIDQEKIARLVPDISERDVFICGPPPMVNGVLPALHALGVPSQRIHFERFSLHKQ